MTVQTDSQNAHSTTLDRLVDEAIGTGDLRRAKELALTPQHWSKIKNAETPKQKSSAEIQAAQASSEECKQAKYNYEREAVAMKQAFILLPQQQELNDAKKRFMYSACGMREPDSTNLNNTVNVYR